MGAWKHGSFWYEVPSESARARRKEMLEDEMRRFEELRSRLLNEPSSLRLVDEESFGAFIQSTSELPPLTDEKRLKKNLVNWREKATKSAEGTTDQPRKESKLPSPSRQTSAEGLPYNLPFVVGRVEAINEMMIVEATGGATSNFSGTRILVFNKGVNLVDLLNSASGTPIRPMACFEGSDRGWKMARTFASCWREDMVRNA